MAKGKLRTCYICNTQYNYCPRCSNEPTWKLVYCSDNCKQIRYILDEVKAGVTKASEAKEALDKLDLSKDNFKDFVKAEIAYINANSTSKKSTKAKKKDEIIDDGDKPLISDSE